MSPASAYITRRQNPALSIIAAAPGRSLSPGGELETPVESDCWRTAGGRESEREGEGRGRRKGRGRGRETKRERDRNKKMER